MLDIIQHGFGIVLLIVFGYFTYISSLLISERKERYRAGTHDYYDNPIEKGDDETIS